MEKLYSVRVDGFEITKVTLSKAEYETQFARDKIRRDIAVTYSVPSHYIRLVDISHFRVLKREEIKQEVSN